MFHFIEFICLLDTPRRGSLIPASPNVAKKSENDESGLKASVCINVFYKFLVLLLEKY